MNTIAQTKLLNRLSALGIVDVYFHKGSLFLVNHYDEEQVSEYLTEHGYTDITVEVVANEDTLRSYG